MSDDDRYCAGCQREMAACTCMEHFTLKKQPDILKQILPDQAAVEKLLRKVFERPVFEDGKKIFPESAGAWQQNVDRVWTWLHDSTWMNAEVRTAFYFALATFSFKEQNELELNRTINSLKKDCAKLRAKIQEQRTQLRRLHESRRIDGAQYNDLYQRHQDAKEEIQKLKVRLSRYEPKGM